MSKPTVLFGIEKEAMTNVGKMMFRKPLFAVGSLWKMLSNNQIERNIGGFGSHRIKDLIKLKEYGRDISDLVNEGVFSVKGSTPDLWGGARKYNRGNTNNELVRGDIFTGKGTPGVVNINSSHVDTLREMGGGRKAYGALFRMVHELAESGVPLIKITSDSSGRTSGQAQNMWKSLMRRGYPIKTKELGEMSYGRSRPIGESTMYEIDVDKLKDFYSKGGVAAKRKIQQEFGSGSPAPYKNQQTLQQRLLEFKNRKYSAKR